MSPSEDQKPYKHLSTDEKLAPVGRPGAWLKGDPHPRVAMGRFIRRREDESGRQRTSQVAELGLRHRSPLRAVWALTHRCTPSELDVTKGWSALWAFFEGVLSSYLVIDNFPAAV